MLLPSPLVQLYRRRDGIALQEAALRERARKASIGQSARTARYEAGPAVRVVLRSRPVQTAEFVSAANTKGQGSRAWGPSVRLALPGAAFLEGNAAFGALRASRNGNGRSGAWPPALPRNGSQSTPSRRLEQVLSSEKGRAMEPLEALHLPVSTKTWPELPNANDLWLSRSWSRGEIPQLDARTIHLLPPDICSGLRE